MIDLVCLGHASLLVRGGGATLVCDPVLSDAVSGGGNLIHPSRVVHADRLPPLDAILLSHHHRDHYCLRSIERLAHTRDLPIFVPRGSSVASDLKLRGYRVEELDVGGQVSFRGLRMTPTPSSVSFPEIGFLFACDGATALNLVDTQIHGVLDELRALVRRPDLVLAPFQAGGYMSLLPLRVGGPPAGLVAAIGRWAREYLEELTDDVARLAPIHAAPFADGIVYRDDAINHWHFPLSDSVFRAALARRGISSSAPRPGMRYEIRPGQVQHRMDDTFVTTSDEALRHSRAFDPSVRIPDFPHRCWETGDSGERSRWVDVAALVACLQKNMTASGRAC